MPVCQNRKCPRNFGFFLRLIPAKTFPENVCHFHHQRMGQLAQVSQQGAAQNQIIEMDDLLAFCHSGDLGTRVAWVGFHRMGIFSRANGKGFCVGFTRQTKQCQGMVGHLLGEGPETGPFAANQRVNGDLTQFVFLDMMVARDLAGVFCLGICQRADAREAEDDLFTRDFDIGKTRPTISIK